MQLIKNNPYRIIGLLVGATAREQDRQVRRLKQFIEADQDLQDDFSFPALGNLHRTHDNIEEAASKLNLDSDKIIAALFWFWNGNPITDEAAFDAIKSGEIETAYEIWDKLVTRTDQEGKRSWKSVTERNFSAFHNFSVLNTIRGNGNLQNAIIANLYFFESDLVHKFVASVADETYKSSKRELQLLFLNELHSDIEANNRSSLSRFLEIITKEEFVAKQDFMKGFVQKPIEQIEDKVNTAKNKRKASKANAAKAGEELFAATTSDLAQLKNIVGSNDLKYASIADKVANEILQCGIDYFNESQGKESNTGYLEAAMELAKQAEAIAIGKLMKDRIKDSIESLSEMKDREISEAISVLQSIKEAYEDACRKIDKHVDELQYDTIPSFGGRAPMRMPKFNVSINWSKVEEMKRNSLAWDKVVELVQEAIPQGKIIKIKNVTNQTKLDEYKSLVHFLMSKLSNTYKKKVGYICFWETPKTISSSSTSPTTQSTSSQSEFDFVANAGWILAIIGLIIGASAGGVGGAVVGFIIGLAIGSRISD